MSFPRYPYYKKSGVQWLGDVPEQWELKRFASVGAEIRRKVSDRDFPALSVTKTGVVPQLETAAKTDDGENRKLVRKGNFVINGRSDRNGSAGVSSFEGSVSLINHVIHLSGIHSLYAHYLLRSVLFQQEFYRNGKGIVADLWSTGFTEMRTIVLALPSRQEQEQIARFVHNETKKIGDLINEQQRLIALLKEKWQAVISHAVATTTVGQLISLRHAVKSIEQGWSPQCDNFQAEPGEWAVLKVGAVNGGVFKPSENKRLPIETDPIPALAVRHGDLLISRANTRELVGSAAVAEKDYPKHLICDKLYRLRARESLFDPRYISLVLGAPGARALFEREGTGASQSMVNIGQDVVLAVQIAKIPLRAQVALVQSAEASTQVFSRLIQHANSAITLLQERRTALISATVTGKIDVRDYHPAA